MALAKWEVAIGMHGSIDCLNPVSGREGDRRGRIATPGSRGCCAILKRVSVVARGEMDGTDLKD